MIYKLTYRHTLAYDRPINQNCTPYVSARLLRWFIIEGDRIRTKVRKMGGVQRIKIRINRVAPILFYVKPKVYNEGDLVQINRDPAATKHHPIYKGPYMVSK